MQVERIIREKPEVSRVYTSVGSTGSMLGNSSKNNTASISVKMIDRAERDIDVYDFSQQIKNEIMQRLPGVRARVSVTGLVDFASHIRREQGMDTFHALIEAGKERLRPMV